MFDPMELERSRIHAEVLAQQAAEAAAQHKILEAKMRLQSLSTSTLAGAAASGTSWGLALLIALIVVVVGFGALVDDVPPAAAAAADPTSTLSGR